MPVRKATLNDAAAIRVLLEQAGYPTPDGQISEKLHFFLSDADNKLLVYDTGNTVAGFIAVHFIPQLAGSGELALISNLVVENKLRWRGIGRELENRAVWSARNRACERLVFTDDGRYCANSRFYAKLGYTELPCYFTKDLIHDETTKK